MFDYVFTL